MNTPSQLSQLILSFYREDPQQFQRISCLLRCKVYRRWRVLRIECPSQVEADILAQAIALIQEPVALLRLARKIKISLSGTSILFIDTFADVSTHHPSEKPGDDADLLL